MAIEPERIRHASLWVKGKKIATMQKLKYSIIGNDERQIADGQYIGHTDGATVSDITCDVIVPISGKTRVVKQAIKDKIYMTCQISAIDGETDTIVMRCTKGDYDSDGKTGALTGSFSLEGGEAEST